MKTSSTSRWPLAAAVGLFVIAGAFALSAVNSPTNAANPPQETTTTSTSGDKIMTATNVQTRIHHASEANFTDLVLKSEVPVLVDFYADWCGPCQRLAPVLEELAAESSNARIVKVDVDRNPSLAAEYRINSIPSLKVFKNGKIAGQMVGLANKSQLRAMLSP
jgi:thioredoxin 1